MNKYENLTQRVEDISIEDKAELIKRMKVTILAGLGIGIFAGFFLFFFNKQSQGDMNYFVIGFAVFFYSILTFILFTAIRNASFKTKIIYTGYVTDKEEVVNRSTKSNMSSSYYIYLDSVKFYADHFFYNQCSKGQKVELQTLGKSQIFKVIVLQDTSQNSKNLDNNSTNEIKIKPVLNTALQFDLYTLEELSLIKKEFISTLLSRVLIGGFVAWVTYYVIIFVLALTFHKLKLHSLMPMIDFFSLAIPVYLFFLINKRTLNLYKDLQEKKKISKEEIVQDIVQSNLRKPSKNSTLRTNGDWNSGISYFYLQTATSWFSITENESKTLSHGDIIKIYETKNTKLRLGYKKKEINE